MIRANLYAFAFGVSDIATQKPLASKSSKRSERGALSEQVVDTENNASPPYLYSESVFWGVYLPC